MQNWQLWAVGTALSAAVTALLIKLGVQGDTAMATLFRSLTGICACFGSAGKWSVDWQELLQLPNYSGWVLISSW